MTKCLVENNTSGDVNNSRPYTIDVQGYPDPNEYYEGHGRENMFKNEELLEKLKKQV